MVGSYSEGYTHGVRSKPTAAITADTPTSAANKIRRNYTSAVRLYLLCPQSALRRDLYQDISQLCFLRGTGA